jgi:hypothetical protein
MVVYGLIRGGLPAVKFGRNQTIFRRGRVDYIAHSETKNLASEYNVPANYFQLHRFWRPPSFLLLCLRWRGRYAEKFVCPTRPPRGKVGTAVWTSD